MRGGYVPCAAFTALIFLSPFWVLLLLLFAIATFAAATSAPNYHAFTTMTLTLTATEKRKVADKFVTAIGDGPPLLLVESTYENSRLDGLALSKGRGSARCLSFLNSIASSGRVDVLLRSAVNCPAAYSIVGGWNSLPGLAEKDNATAVTQALREENVLAVVEECRKGSL